MPKNQTNSGGNNSNNKTSETDISSETRNSYNIHPWAWKGNEDGQRKYTSSTKEIKGNTIKSPVNRDTNKQIWGKNENGDLIPKANTHVNDGREAFVAKKNNDKMVDGKNSESKIRKWGKGGEYADSENEISHVDPDERKNAKLWERNKDGDAIPKPNHEWLSEEEIGDTLSKPKHQFRFAEEDSKNEVVEKGINRKQEDSEEISDEDENVPSIADSSLSLQDVVDSAPNSYPDTGEKIDTNENTVTQFLRDNGKSERNDIPTSKTDIHKITKENKKENG